MTTECLGAQFQFSWHSRFTSISCMSNEMRPVGLARCITRAVASVTKHGRCVEDTATGRLGDVATQGTGRTRVGRRV